MTWTLLVVMAARSCRRRRTALLQPQGQLGGEDKRLLLLPLDGGVHRRLVVVVAVGEALRPVQEEEEAPGGVEVPQVLGHPPQQVDGVLTQPQPQQLVRGVQEAAVGEQAAQLETPAGAAPIRRRKAAGTCDAYSVAPRRLYLDLTHDQRFPYRKQ